MEDLEDLKGTSTQYKLAVHEWSYCLKIRMYIIISEYGQVV